MGSPTPTTCDCPDAGTPSCHPEPGPGRRHRPSGCVAWGPLHQESQESGPARRQPEAEASRCVWPGDVAGGCSHKAGGRQGLKIRARGSDCCGDLITPALPQECQPPGMAGTPRAACVWSTSRSWFTPSEGLWGCWPPWSTASSWPEGPGSRPGLGRRRYGCWGSRDEHRPQALPVCSRAPPHSPHKSPCWAGGSGFSPLLSPWLVLPRTPSLGLHCPLWFPHGPLGPGLAAPFGSLAVAAPAQRLSPRSPSL